MLERICTLTLLGNLLWFGLSGCMFLEFDGGNNLNSLFLRLHSFLQRSMVKLNVCICFWMEGLMWLPKMWDERKRWKIESVGEWIRRREGETVRLTGECVLEEEWMTDICISFGMWNRWIYFNLPSNRTMYVSPFFIVYFWMDLSFFNLHIWVVTCIYLGRG